MGTDEKKNDERTDERTGERADERAAAGGRRGRRGTAGGRLGLFGRLVTAVATLGPLGTRLPAPGTWGSAVGILLYVVFFRPINSFSNFVPHYLGYLCALSLFAIVVCWIAEIHIGRTDPSEVILDEVVAMPLVFIGAESFVGIRNIHGGTGDYAFLWFLGGFALFRFFDIAKPFGIRYLQRLPGGIGIVVDDLAAGAFAWAVLHLVNIVVRFGGM
jgi:phosphatidylglycerophosphatase A